MNEVLRCIVLKCNLRTNILAYKVRLWDVVMQSLQATNVFIRPYSFKESFANKSDGLKYLTCGGGFVFLVGHNVIMLE